MDRDLASAYAAALDAVLRRDHLMAPDALDELTVVGARRLGARTAVLWLVDYDQVSLGRLGGPSGVPGERLSVDGSLAGRCFRSVETMESDGEDGHLVWVPLLDGIERLGVLEAVFDADAPPVTEDLRSALGQLAHLLAELLVSNAAYTDHYEWVRRRQAMTLPAEMQHRLLPPLTFGTDRVVISGLLAPAYDVGGDAFDYALNGNIAHVAVFDAVGHGPAGQPARQPRGVLLPQHPRGRASTWPPPRRRSTRRWTRCSAASASSRDARPARRRHRASSAGSTPATRRRCCCATARW
jgi:hypothetical protein